MSRLAAAATAGAAGADADRRAHPGAVGEERRADLVLKFVRSRRKKEKSAGEKGETRGGLN